MRILRLDPEKPDREAMKTAAVILKRGGLVVYPTETAYGLGCDPASIAALKKIYSVKKREPSKPLPLIAATRKMAERYAKFDALSAVLAEEFWPGPLTLVMPARGRTLARGAISRGGEAAIRVSPHPIARALAGLMGRPIVSTSANLSGGEPLYDVLGVLKELGVFPDLYLDAGKLSAKRPSTLVRCAEGCCAELRPGPISMNEISRTLKRSCPISRLRLAA